MNPRRRLATLLMTLLLLVVTACQWPSVRGGATNDAFAADETTLALDDAGSVTELFSGDLGLSSTSAQAPVVAGSQIFAPSSDGLAVFDLNGESGCSGAPRRCEPTWRGAVGGAIESSPTVSGATVFVAWRNGTQHALAAFDVRGETGCGGSPRVCQPLWSAPGFGIGVPVVAGGTVFAMGRGHRTIGAFDARGSTGCSGSPKVCTPLWTTLSDESGSEMSPVAVADGTLFQTTTGGDLAAFDATGVDGCSGSPKTCRPLWIGRPGGFPRYWPTAPVISGGRVYVSVDSGIISAPGQHDDGELTWVVGFALDGGADCESAPGAPPECAPEWRGAVPGMSSIYDMAAAYGSIFVQVRNLTPSVPGGEQTGALAAFSLTDAACVPGPCAPTWTAALTPAGQRSAAPIVANGAVFAERSGAIVALDAHGMVGCSGTPVRCAPSTFISYDGLAALGSAISNGKVVTITIAPTSSGRDRQTLRVFG